MEQEQEQEQEKGSFLFFFFLDLLLVYFNLNISKITESKVDEPLDHVKTSSTLPDYMVRFLSISHTLFTSIYRIILYEQICM